MSHFPGSFLPRISRNPDGLLFSPAHGSTTYGEVQQGSAAFGNLKITSGILDTTIDSWQRTLNRPRSDLLLILECCASADCITSIQKGSVFSLQNSMQCTCFIADTDNGARLESDNNRERLERMSKALLNGECKNINGDHLYGRIVG